MCFVTSYENVLQEMADDISAAQPTRPTAVVPTLSTRRLSWTSTESPAKPFVNRSQPNSWSMTWCSTQKPILRSSAKTRQVLRRPFVVHAYYYYYTILSQEPKQLNCRNLIVVERRLHLQHFQDNGSLVSVLYYPHNALDFQGGHRGMHRNKGTFFLPYFYIQSNPYKMFAAYFQPSWPSRPKNFGGCNNKNFNAYKIY